MTVSKCEKLRARFLDEVVRGESLAPPEGADERLSHVVDGHYSLTRLTLSILYD